MAYEMETEAEPLPEEKMKKSNKIILSIFLFLIIFPTVPFLFYRYSVSKNFHLVRDQTFEIKAGQGISEIATNLNDAGIINSTFLFKVYLKLNKLDTKLQAGVYVMPKTYSIAKLAELFQYGRNDVSIRFIEGWRREELGIYLANELKNFDYEKFIEITQDYEGRLFPDTYVVQASSNEKEVFDLLTSTFKDKTENLVSKANLDKLGLTENEAYTMASIIEREARHESERKLIAGILLKRFNEGMKIEADATTQYAVALYRYCVPFRCQSDPSASNCEQTGQITQCLLASNLNEMKEVVWWPNNLTIYDLDNDSPYNTRKNVGMPPAPISSFSLSSLDAVINYTPSDYYFYLTDHDGVTHFAVTNAEHEANIAKYLN